MWGLDRKLHEVLLITLKEPEQRCPVLNQPSRIEDAWGGGGAGITRYVLTKHVMFYVECRLLRCYAVWLL
jgi:hypothetical protein